MKRRQALQTLLGAAPFLRAAGTLTAAPVQQALQWKISGAGPGTQKTATEATNFNENARRDLTSNDVRFTTKGDVLFAFVMGVPEQRALIPFLAFNAQSAAGKIANLELLGYPGKLHWTQNDSGLSIDLPATKPCKHALAFKIHGLL